MSIKSSGWIFLFLSIFMACKMETKNTKPINIDIQGSLLHQLNNQLTEAIIQDGFSPPVASRIYAYSNIAAHEAMALFSPKLTSLSGKLNELEKMDAFPDVSKLHPEIVLIKAFERVAAGLIYRDYLIEQSAEALLEKVENKTEVAISKAAGEAIAEHILNWAGKDGYRESRNYPLFVAADSAGSWVATPPTYGEAIEPYWGQLRPFFLKSSKQFQPKPPTHFSIEKETDFYKGAMQVYQAVKDLDSSQLEIAKFWDCNPFVSINQGHTMFNKRQLTPGGHWMGIARTTCQKVEADIFLTTQTYTLTALALADGFISCWDEKYRSNLIRPETYINQYIDPLWRPILETPLFPEHTSGHSVISAASATVLTYLHGANFSYVDEVNVPFGLPARSFTSFFEAADEAAVSRLYGGIHYMPAIEFGKVQGRQVGAFILAQLAAQE